MIANTSSQPTGGPLLLDDTQPNEAKSLIEEKLKKLTTERAPVAGQQSGRSGGGGRSGGPGRSLLEGLVDPARASTGNPVMDQLLRGQVRSPFAMADPQTPAGNAGEGAMGSGAAAAAGVLTAVDEDGEDGEEAQAPWDFDYISEGEGGE